MSPEAKAELRIETCILARSICAERYAASRGRTDACIHMCRVCMTEAENVILGKRTEGYAP